MKSALVAFSLAAAFACAPFSTEAAAPTLLQEWVTFDTDGNTIDDDDFDGPYGITTNAAGDTVYVSDTYNHRILQFTSDGDFLASWGSFCDIHGTHDNDDDNCEDPVGFWSPVGMTTDSDGYVYIAEWSNDRVQKFRPDGVPVAEWGQRCVKSAPPDCDMFPLDPLWLRNADDVAIDENLGRAYVVDRRNNRILILDQNAATPGSSIGVWGRNGGLNGEAGIGDGEFNLPVGIAVDPATGHVYVAEAGNHRIQKLDSNGNTLAKWGRVVAGNPVFGTGQKEFYEPIHIAIDSQSRVYIPDSKNNRIQVIDKDGVFLCEWNEANTGDPLNEPEAVAVDPVGGFIFVADTQNDRILKYEPLDPPVGLATFCVDTANVMKVGDYIEVPLLVTTGKSIDFTNMTVEYDSSCATFENAILGNSTGNAGQSVTGIAQPGTNTDLALNYHVTVSVTEDYAGVTDYELVRLRFKLVNGAILPCRLVWDQFNIGGNPPNQLLTFDPSEIRAPDIIFKDGEIPIGTPPTTSATFEVDTPNVMTVGSFIEVPLLVTTGLSIDFTNMTIEYDSSCAKFEGAVLGNSTGSAGQALTGIVQVGTNTNLSLNKRVTVSVTEDYAAVTDFELVRLRFTLAGGTPAPCELGWDTFNVGGNPPNQLLTFDPSEIRPPDITFLDGEIPPGVFNQPTDTNPGARSKYLLRSYPNPFNPMTRAQFTIPDAAGNVPVRLGVYDISGRRIRNLLQERRGPGDHSVVWNGRGDDGSQASAGIYLLRIQAGEWSGSEKLVLVK